jgi:type IV pilus assembly protein PilE
MIYTIDSGRHFNSRRSAGFTLIEVMITLVIVGVVTAIALPSYRSYILKSHRAEAVQALTQYQSMIERCYAQNLVYNGTCYAALSFPVNSTNGYYSIGTTNMGAATYTLTATAQNAQAADGTCLTFTIDQTNTRTVTPAATPAATCWNP